MIFPQAVTYALDALSYLVKNSGGSYVKIKQIAEETGIPQHFLGKVMTQLVRKKLIVSSKGPTGGVALIKNPTQITIFDVLQALDAQNLLEDNCILGLWDCSDCDSCPFHDKWGRFKKDVLAVARTTTLAHLARK